jgi:formylglycine-generating enzyme required for sulfatase activity
MGCVSARDDGCISDELPAHEVWLDAFEMDVYEVTQARWQACVEAGACPVPDMDQTCLGKWDPVALADHPVVCVDFNASVAYCEWAGKRLPTEAEWEKAARGTDARLHPWGDQSPTCELANFEAPDGECVSATTPVGSYPQGGSPFGIQDMAGSVWERTMDWYAPDYYVASPYENPTGAVTGTARVLRGGGFTSVGKFLRATARDGARAPWKTARNVGLRCARTP